MTGTVYLVGAGPGDPELLTLKALRVLRTADAVLHDDLVAPEILQFVPPTAQVYNVGKRCGTKRIRQDEINSLMVTLAASGLTVVRLKSGDPLIFGRAGEEIEALRRANIPCEIVPGITSAVGAAAAAQIPLTHRDVSSALVFLTAHNAPGRDATNWSKLVASGATLVIYMPGQHYGTVGQRLTAAGVKPHTACVVVSRATTPNQQAYCTTVRDLHKAPQFPAPSLLIVGVVARSFQPGVVSSSLIAESLAIGRPLPATFFETSFPTQSVRLRINKEPVA